MVNFPDFFEPAYLISLFRQHLLHRSTIGRDGVSPSQFASSVAREAPVIQRKVLDGSYRFTPYREMLRVKKAGVNPRVLSAPTIRDQLVLRALKEYLHEVFPTRVDRKPANKLVRETAELIYQPHRDELRFFRTDILGFYDHIDHSTLLGILSRNISDPQALRLIKAAIRTPTLPAPYPHTRTNRNMCGVPQGLAISNILASLYLIDFDAKLRGEVRLYARYVDDLLLLSDVAAEAELEDLMDSEVARLSLRRNPDKTYSGLVKDGFEFLGYRFDVNGLTVSSRNVQRYLDSVAGQLTRFRRGLPGHLGRHPWISRNTAINAFLEDFNERITGAISENRRYGWVFYFSEMADVKLLKHMDSIIRNMVSRSPELRNVSTKVKRLARAYYAAKNRRWSYFRDYNQILTPMDKARYLSDRGFLARNESYRDEAIEALFVRVRSSRLARLERDIGDLS